MTTNETLKDLEFDESVKICVVGDCSSGKTSLVQRFLNGSFNPSVAPTLAVDFHSKIVEIGENRVKVMIWDTASQSRFKGMTSIQLKQADIVILTYPLAAEEAIDKLGDDGMKEILGGHQISFLAVVGTKSDLLTTDVQNMEDIEQYCSSYYPKANIVFAETSAKLNSNIQELFLNIIHDCIELRKIEYNSPLKSDTTLDGKMFLDINDEMTEEIITGTLNFKVKGRIARSTQRKCTIKKAGSAKTNLYFLEVDISETSKPKIYNLNSSKFELVPRKNSFASIVITTYKPKRQILLKGEDALTMNNWRMALKQCGLTEKTKRHFFKSSTSSDVSDQLM